MNLRNSIMEEVILKNYKLLQYVEKEMNQLKDEIKLLKEENASLKKEIEFFKETNKNLFCCNIQICCDIQNIQDTFENTMIIGYDKLYKPILFNVEKAFLISFNKCTDLSNVVFTEVIYSVICFILFVTMLISFLISKLFKGCFTLQQIIN